MGRGGDPVSSLVLFGVSFLTCFFSTGKDWFHFLGELVGKEGEVVTEDEDASEVGDVDENGRRRGGKGGGGLGSLFLAFFFCSLCVPFSIPGLCFFPFFSDFVFLGTAWGEVGVRAVDPTVSSS